MQGKYDWYQDSCGCDDIYVVTCPKGKIVKVIVFWDDEPEWVQRAGKRAERICRWLNRTPPLRILLSRILRRFDPTGNNPTWDSLYETADYLYGDTGDHQPQKVAARSDAA